MNQMRIRHFSLIICLFFQHSDLFSQDINFKDLSRSGPPVIKRYSVDGIEADGREYLLKFDGVDSARVDTRNANIDAARASGSSETSSSRSTSSQSPSKSSQKNKNFICEIFCESTKGPRISRELSGASRDEVAKYVDGNAHRICNESGVSKRASAVSLSPSQCREK